MFLVPKIQLVSLHGDSPVKAQGKIACAGSIPSQNKGFPHKTAGKQDEMVDYCGSICKIELIKCQGQSA
jgi:hypothetical protein